VRSHFSRVTVRENTHVIIATRISAGDSQGLARFFLQRCTTQDLSTERKRKRERERERERVLLSTVLPSAQGKEGCTDYRQRINSTDCEYAMLLIKQNSPSLSSLSMYDKTETKSFNKFNFLTLTIHLRINILFGTY